ncbi:hypothetical protein LY78DRAFT_316193 [Colletotrichum sublineola]|nr:hypothetical protein LY78DRAFT_316193 [Colletotrichum sublineola]
MMGRMMVCWIWGHPMGEVSRQSKRSGVSPPHHLPDFSVRDAVPSCRIGRQPEVIQNIPTGTGETKKKDCGYRVYTTQKDARSAAPWGCRGRGQPYVAPLLLRER